MRRTLKVPILLIDVTAGDQTAYDVEIDAILDARALEEKGHEVRVYERQRSSTNPRGIARRVIYPVLGNWALEE